MPSRRGHWRNKYGHYPDFPTVMEFGGVYRFQLVMVIAMVRIRPLRSRIDNGVRTYLYRKHNSIGISFAVPVNPQIRIRRGN